jgi:hypothetical protein
VPLFREAGVNQFVPLVPTNFTDLEKDLETWIAPNPLLLGSDPEIAIFSRQPRTAHGKLADLLGIDETGAVVVIELKRDKTPRDVIAQTLEYSAWVNTLSLDDLDQLAHDYGTRPGAETSTLVDVYRQHFGDDREDVAGLNDITDRITFNHRQRMIIVAEHFSPEVEETLRYLRTKHGIDIVGVRFGLFKDRAGNGLIIETDTIVGRERLTDGTGKQPQTRQPETDASILARVETDFMRHAVTAIEDWVVEFGTPEIEIRHGAQSYHDLYIHATRHLTYYYARQWINCYLFRPTIQEIERLRQSLSKPEQVANSDRGNHVRFHLATESDLAILQDILLQRQKTQ